MAAPVFEEDKTVVGQSLCEFIEWAKNSLQPEAALASAPDKPLGLPPIQRSAVWNAKKIVDLWDSVLRGLPIGIFYLLTRAGTGQARRLDGKSIEGAGFDLLDGQQRLRALLLGWAEISDDRCLWVDLAPTDSSSFRLFITSKTQPFGYDPATGRKWPTHDRRKAREAIEPKDHPILVLDQQGNPRLGDDGKPRSAYDSELFSGNVAQDGKKIEEPPKPYRSSGSTTFKLRRLLRAWREGNLDALTKEAPGASEAAIAALHKAFKRLKAAHVALLKVDLGALQGDDAVLALFERVGAGGEPLSNEERLYSIYKHHKKEIQELVENISATVGKILPPTKIVTTALRIANARKKQPSFSVPDVALFAKEMKDQESELHSNLNGLIPSGRTGPLQQGFEAIKNILSFQEGEDAFWLPDVLLATLPPGVWQVLVFWASSLPEGTQWNESRKEAVRFALFWRLCVWNDEKATVRCFEYLCDINKATVRRSEYLRDIGDKVFPAIKLYQILIGHEGDKCAQDLISAEDFDKHFDALQETPVWRTDADRFVAGKIRNEMCARWWWNGKALLPWLQRDYIRKAFPDYAPLTDHEDDIPYDLDHVCPSNDWRQDWRLFQHRLDAEVQNKEELRGTRDQIGAGIGNLRLVGSAQNRGDGDTDVEEKMCFIKQKPESDKFKKGMKDWAFSAEIAPWRLVSRSGAVADRKWNNERLQAFQVAVEKRAVYLYQRFHDDLEYSSWTSSRHQGEDAVNEHVTPKV